MDGAVPAKPTSETSAIVKREWWQTWEENPPVWFRVNGVGYGVWENNQADYCSDIECLPPRWQRVEQWRHFLNAFRERMGFQAKTRIYRTIRQWQPDSLLVEKKRQGAANLRASGDGNTVRFTPTRGNDKITRLNAVSDLFASGLVWAPNTNWAEEVIDEVASFPSGEHDDYVDSVSLAMMRYRKGGFIRLPSDEAEEVQYFKQRRGGYY